MAGQSPPAAPLRLLTAAGTQVLPTVVMHDVEYVALDRLAAIFGVVVREDALARGVTVTWRGRTVVLTPDQPLASVGGRLVSLPGPPARIDGRWHVPVEFIAGGLAPLADSRLELRKASRLVIYGDLRVPRVVVRHDVPANQARLTFEITPPTPHTIVQNASELVVRFDADAIDPVLPTFTPQGFVQSIRAVEGSPVIAIELGPRFGSFRGSDAPPNAAIERLVLDVFGATEAPDAPAAGVPPTEAPPVFPAPAAGLRTIVLDAGHGGDETGARGPKGTLEKNVTLSVARRLRSAIEARLGARVLMTRDDDRVVGLDERAALANNNKADLFISLHANASVRSETRGAEVFYLSLERSDAEARRIAESGGAAMALFGGGTRDVDVIPWDMAQARYVDQSAVFARMTEASLRGAVPVSPRALLQAPFRVLVGANMPAVLVEIGYLSNPAEEDLIVSAAFQGRVVQALADAVVGFDAHVRGSSAAATAASVAPGAAAPRGQPQQ